MEKINLHFRSSWITYQKV